MNLAIADVHVLTRALSAFYQTKDTGRLEAYTDTVRRRIWRAQQFSYWMTSMLHRFSEATDHDLLPPSDVLVGVHDRHGAAVSPNHRVVHHRLWRPALTASLLAGRWTGSNPISAGGLISSSSAATACALTSGA
jgi:2-polyprenyl-6-methoxyphenol hydroxylase-like FAD-dependent oxidoreductase